MDCCRCTALPPVCKHAIMCVGSCCPWYCVRMGLKNREFVNYAAASGDRRYGENIPLKYQDPTRACPCIVGCLCCPFVIAHHNSWWVTMRTMMGEHKVQGGGSDDPAKEAERIAWIERNEASCSCGYPWFCCDDTACCESARCCPCSTMGYPCGFSEVFSIEHLDGGMFSPRGANNDDQVRSPKSDSEVI